MRTARRKFDRRARTNQTGAPANHCKTRLRECGVAALALLSWTLVVNIPRNPAPYTKTGFPTKRACEEAGAKWRANFETQVKEGTIRTDTDRRRRLARAIPSIKCVESAEPPPAHP